MGRVKSEKNDFLGTGIKLGKKDLPGVGRCNSRLTFPRDYFYINYFSVQILERSSHGEYHLFEKILISNKRQLIYIMLWLKIGKDLEKTIEILKSQRILNIKSIQGRVRVNQHPVFRTKVGDVNTLDISRFAGTLTDSAVLLWNEVLEDFLFCASEHLQHFISATQNVNLPSYSDIAKGTSIPE